MEKIVEIYTERLVLRKAQKKDLEYIWKNVWSDEGISEMMLGEPTKTLEDAKRRMDNTIRYQEENYAYFICLKDTDEAIGFCGIYEKRPGVCEETGICISAKYQNKGLGKEVLRALLELAFDKLKFKKFIYSCFENNEISKRLCKEFGFKFLGKYDIVRKWDNKKIVSEGYYLNNPNIKKRVYIAHSKDINYKDELYLPVRTQEDLKKYEIILPHEESESSNNTRKFYSTIDIMIVEVTEKATGLGIECAWAYDDDIPVYCIYKKGSKISGSLHSITNNFYEYENEKEMIDIIKKIIEGE